MKLKRENKREKCLLMDRSNKQDIIYFIVIFECWYLSLSLSHSLEYLLYIKQKCVFEF